MAKSEHVLKDNYDELRQSTNDYNWKSTLCFFISLLVYQGWLVNTGGGNSQRLLPVITVLGNTPNFGKVGNTGKYEPGRVAQSVGHLTRKSGVLGSIPGLATYFRFSFRFFKKGSCQLLAKVCARSTG